MYLFLKNDRKSFPNQPPKFEKSPEHDWMIATFADLYQWQCIWSDVTAHMKHRINADIYNYMNLLYPP